MSGGFDSEPRTKQADLPKSAAVEDAVGSSGSSSGRGDTVGKGDRSTALRQIHRSLKAWRSEDNAHEAGRDADAEVDSEGPAVQRKIFRTPENDDDWRRQPDSLQEQMALDAAKAGAGDVIIPNLSDPRYKGMSKKEYKVTSKEGAKVCVHYVFDPKTGKSMDFKFKETKKPPGIGRKVKD